MTTLSSEAHMIDRTKITNIVVYRSRPRDGVYDIITFQSLAFQSNYLTRFLVALLHGDQILGVKMSGNY